MGSAAAGPCLDLEPAGGRRLSRQASWTATSAPRPQPLSLRHPHSVAREPLPSPARPCRRPRLVAQKDEWRHSIDRLLLHHGPEVVAMDPEPETFECYQRLLEDLTTPTRVAAK